jgi:hypothetical protein
VSFLNPLLWLGAIAAAAPLWLHLRAKRGKVFHFSTLRFLEDQPRPPLHGVRLRDLALFLARLSAVLLLVAAFAWPYLRSGHERIAESRVHILDNTLSQRVADGFELDRKRLRDALRAAGPETQDAVIELTSRPRVVVALTDSRVEADRKLAALTPSFERGAYIEAFRLAQSILRQSLGTRKRILVYADHQENQWTENEASPPFLEGVEVELAAPSASAFQPNLSLSDTVIRRVFVGDDAYVDLSARLRHEGSYPRTRVVLKANEREILREDVQLERDRESITLRAQWRSDPAAWVKGELALEGASDGLAADDRVVFCLPPVKEGRVALLARSPYVRAALAPEVMRGRWSARALDPTAPGLAQEAENDLAEVLLLEGDYAQSEAVRTLAFRYLNNGRGVILTLSRTTPLLRQFLQQLDFEASSASGPESEQGFRYVATDHPIFKPFVGGELGDLMQTRVFRHLRLRSPQAVPLVFGSSGDALVLESAGTKGRLLVFAFGLDRSQTDWPLLPSFIPFLDLCLQHARSATRIETSAIPGAPLVHDLEPDASAREVAVRSGQKELARVPVDANRRALLRAPAEPGIYAITYDADTAVRAMIAVNPAAEESVLRYVRAPVALQAWRIASDGRSAAAEPVPRAMRSAALSQRHWWWLLAAGTLALALESVFLLRRRERT